VAKTDRSSSEATAVASMDEDADRLVSFAVQAAAKFQSPSRLDHSSGSTCSDSRLSEQDMDGKEHLRCTCATCPRHSPAKLPGDSRLEEFLRRTALHMINAAKPMR
jgi:hypothetical protein